MVTVLEEGTTEKQRFLWAKGLTAKDINKETFPVYDGKCLSRKAVHSWVEKFFQGRSKVSDDAPPGRTVETATEATVQWVEELIRADRRITIDGVATALGCSHGLAYSIIHGRLKFRKVCARRVPRELKEREKMNRMGLSLQLLLCYADEGEDMLTELLLGTNHGCITSKLAGKRFADEEVETEVRKWLKQQLKHFYVAGFDAPVKLWYNCINVGRGYVEK
jgi:hypothetical protein